MQPAYNSGPVFCANRQRHEISRNENYFAEAEAESTHRRRVVVVQTLEKCDAAQKSRSHNECHCRQFRDITDFPGVYFCELFSHFLWEASSHHRKNDVTHLIQRLTQRRVRLPLWCYRQPAMCAAGLSQESRASHWFALTDRRQTEDARMKHVCGLSRQPTP